MITDKQIQKAIRQAPDGGKKIELRDPGPRGSGRLTVVVRSFPGHVAAEWYAVYYRGGRRCMAKLGSYPEMTIVAARAIFASDYVTAIAAGIEPETMARRRSQQNGTVKELFAAYVDHLRRDGKRSAHQVDLILLSKNGAASAIGENLAASSVTPSDIVPHLAKIHKRGARVQANAVRAYILAAFAFGLRAEHDFTRASAGVRWGLKTNPAAAIPVDGGASNPGNRFLSPAEFGSLWKWLDERRPNRLAASAVMLKLAIGQRSEEIARITDSAYDRDKAMLNWDMTKNGRPHAIPLPHQATAILDAMVPTGHGFYFPHRLRPDLPATSDIFARLVDEFIAESGVPHFTPRDLRRTWKTLAGDAGIPKDMRDRLQNHAQGGDVSSRHYDRYDYLPERRAAMARWAAYLDLVIEGKVDQLGAQIGNVVPFGRTAVA
jgi:integrase